MNVEGFMHVLPLVLYGMGGIFGVTFVIYAVVSLLNKAFSPKK